MKVLTKIYIISFLNALLIGAVFFFVLPKMSDSLINLRNSHQDQIIKLQALNEEAKNLSKMTEDLNNLKKLPYQPSTFFASDVTLENEIRSIEAVAALTNTQLTLGISGTADKAQAVTSASKLAQVPYTMTLKGDFPNILKFIQYMENRYFIAPIGGMNIVGSEDADGKNKTVTATILSSFYIYK